VLVAFGKTAELVLVTGFDTADVGFGFVLIGEVADELEVVTVEPLAGGTITGGVKGAAPLVQIWLRLSVFISNSITAGRLGFADDGGKIIGLPFMVIATACAFERE